MSRQSCSVLLVLTTLCASLPAQAPADSIELDEARRIVREQTGLTFAWFESLIRRSIISTDTPYGFKVERVNPGSPAGKAGIRRGDVILEWDGRPLRSLGKLGRRLHEIAPGTRVSVLVARKKPRTGLFPRNPWREFDATLELGGDPIRAKTGLEFAVLESIIRRRFISTNTPYGFKVAAVVAGSPADRAGIRPGDVVLEWAGKPLRSLADLRRWLGQTEHGRTIGLRCARPGKDRPWTVGIVRFRLPGDPPDERHREL